MEGRIQYSASDLKIEKLSKSEDLSFFSCGCKDLDLFFQKEIHLCVKYKYVSAYCVKDILDKVIQAEEEKERLALENKKQQKQIEKLQPKADFADAAFKKILFSFGSMESLRNFVPFTDDDCIRYVKQAVKLPYHTCFFLCPYWILAVAFT